MTLPISLAEAKAQLRIEQDDFEQDEAILTAASDAVGWVEKASGHILVARDETESFRGYGAVRLKAWPIKQDAKPGVAFIDQNGSPVAILGARLDLSSRPARVLPPSGSFFSFRDTQQLFTVTIRAGYEPAEVLPGNLRRAILLLIGGYFRDRDGSDVLEKSQAAAQRLCGPFRLRRL